MEWTIEGRLAGGKRGADIIATLEKTYAVLAGSAGQVPKETADQLWRGVMLGGSLRDIHLVDA